MDKDPLEKTDWVTPSDYVHKICAAQGYENSEEFMNTKWAQRLASVYGVGKVRVWAAKAIERLRREIK